MLKFLTVAALLSPVFFVVQTHAQTPLTLDQAISSFQTSPRMEKARSISEESEWKRVEAFSQFLPTLSASAQRLLDKKYMLTDVAFVPTPIPQIIPTTNYILGAQWTLFDGFANVDRYKSAKRFEEASKKELSWAEFQGQREVIVAFYKSLGAKILEEVALQNQKALLEHSNDVKLFRKAGISTKFDVLQVEVQASQAKSEVLNAQDSASVSTLRLGEILGTQLNNRTLQGKLPELDENLVKDIETSISNRADLQALEKRVEGFSELSDAAGKHWVPKVGLVGQFQHYNNRGDEYDGTQFRDAYTVGIQLAWNYDGIVGPMARSGIATEQKYQAIKTLEMSKLKAENDLEFWKRRFLYSVSVYKDRKGDIDKTAESVRLAREGRRAGTITNTNLLDAEAEQFRARAQMVNAQISAVEALVNLELMTGKEIYKFQ